MAPHTRTSGKERVTNPSARNGHAGSSDPSSPSPRRGATPGPGYGANPSSAQRTDHRSPSPLVIDQPRWLEREEEDKVPARRALTRRRIVMTALSVVEEDGLDALTMRRVASALNVTPMSLYNHVADKAELVDLMVDFLIGQVMVQSADDRGDWEARLRALVLRNHSMLRSHPGLVRVYAEGVTPGPNGLAAMDLAVGLLRQAGFDDAEAGAAFMVLFQWSMGTLLVGGEARTSDPSMSSQEHIRALFSALPLEDMPNVVATMRGLSDQSNDFGLDVIMAGLRARLAAKKPESRRDNAS